MHAVSGRFICLPKFVNESWESPKPWSKMRMFVGASPLAAVLIVSFRKYRNGVVLLPAAGYLLRVVPAI